MRTPLLVVSVALAAITLGCVGLTACNRIQGNLSEVKTHTETIRETAKDAAKVAPVVKPQMTKIEQEADTLDGIIATAQMDHAEKVKTLEKALIAAQSDARKKDEVIAELKSSVSARTKQLLAIIIVASGLALGGSIALLFWSKFKTFWLTVGLALIFGSAVALQVALNYLIWIALAFGLLVAGLIGYWAWLQTREAEPIQQPSIPDPQQQPQESK